MTEKFKWDTIEGDVVFYEDDAMIDYDDVIDLLNKQYKTIQKFKDIFKELEEIGDYQANRIDELNEEVESFEKVLLSISTRDLLPTERILLNTICNELNIDLKEKKITNVKTCQTCSYKYRDDFCMLNCTYVNNNHKCQKWTDKPLKFNYDLVYRLCKQYIETCKDYEHWKQLCEKYPDKKSLKLSEPTYEFFFNCCINDLHRELSLWRTKR